MHTTGHKHPRLRTVIIITLFSLLLLLLLLLLKTTAKLVHRVCDTNGVSVLLPVPTSNF
jgi:hypothetical protein